MLYDVCGDLGTLAEKPSEQSFMVSPIGETLLRTTRHYGLIFANYRIQFPIYSISGREETQREREGYIDNLERLGHPVTLGLAVSLILIGLRKEFDSMLKLHEQTLNLPKNNAPALHAIRAGKVQKGHWKRNCPQYLAELLKKKKNAASGAGGGSGLRASRKLKSGALSLYVGNGQREAVEAIGNFDLSLPSGLCNPKGCYYEIELSNSNANESSIYTVSNKRAKRTLLSCGIVVLDTSARNALKSCNTIDFSIQLTLGLLKNASLVCLERWQENLTHIKWKGPKTYLD
ncbi:hypothetical protein Tco_0721851 [Tanacetum coccineum]